MVDKKTSKILINKECIHVTIISQPYLKSLIIFILQLFWSVVRANKFVDFFSYFDICHEIHLLLWRSVILDSYLIRVLKSDFY